MSEDIYFTPASEAHRKKEKAKAKELRDSIWWKQLVGKGKCYHCELQFKSTELTMDHLIPIVRGGKSDKKNCVPSCKDCNTKKGYKTRAEMALDNIKDELNKNDDSSSDES